MITAEGTDLGQVNSRGALAVDAAGNLYVADVVDLHTGNARIQKRDAHGNWSVITSNHQALLVSLLAVDPAGNLHPVVRFCRQ